MCSTILSGFYTISASFLISMHKTYFRQNLEYNTVIWSPSCLAYINKCERVQLFFIKRLSVLWDTPYLHRLNILNLESLEERRLYNDKICIFKLFHGLFNLNVNEFFTLSHNSRGHALKIFKPCCTHS